MSVLLDDRLLTATVRDVLTVDGALAPVVGMPAFLQRANAPGSLGSVVTVAPRTITIGLDVWPTTLPDRVTVLDALRRRVEGLRLFRMEDSPTREQYVVCTSVRVEFYHISIPRCYVEVQCVAVDPTRYEREPRAVALTTARTECPIGNTTSAPLVYLYGASPSVVNPVVIVRNASGDETHRLTLTGTLATADALLVDCARQTITRYVSGVVQTGTNSGNAWLTSGVFPLLAPEDAIDGAGITIELAATTGTPTGLALYQRGY